MTERVRNGCLSTSGCNIGLGIWCTHTYTAGAVCMYVCAYLCTVFAAGWLSVIGPVGVSVVAKSQVHMPGILAYDACEPLGWFVKLIASFVLYSFAACSYVERAAMMVLELVAAMMVLELVYCTCSHDSSGISILYLQIPSVFSFPYK